MTAPTQRRLSRGFVLHAYEHASAVALSELATTAPSIVIEERPGMPSETLRYFHISCPDLSRRPEPLPAGMRTLSERELQVLRLTAEGLDRRAIARRLGLKRSTVKTHMARICRALLAADRVHAVLIALRHGLLQEAP